MAALGVVVALLALVPSAGATIATKPLVTWQTNGRVLAILQVGPTTFVGGKFTQISNHSGTTQNVLNLAAFNSSGNPVTAAMPQPNGAVKALATDGSGHIFLAGSFTKVGTSGRNHIAEMTTTGTLITKAVWAGAADGDVEALAVASANLYMAGTFTTADGQPRTSLAAVALTNGSLQPWAPFVDGRVDTLTVNGTNLVACGFFANAGSSSGGHPWLAAFDATSGALQPGYVMPTNSQVVSMAQDGSGGIYVGTTNNRLIGFNPAGTSITWQRGTDGNVQALAVSDGEVIAGGHFANFCDVGTNCNNPVIRNHIAALDPSTGTIDTTWAPSVNSTLGVFALADTTIGLAVGGDFTKIGGSSQAHLAFLATGSSVPIDSTPPKFTVAPDAILRKATTVTGGAVPLLVRYTATDPSGICSYHLERSKNGSPFAPVALTSATAASKPITLVPSQISYRYQASAADCVGNPSAFTKGPSLRLTAFQDRNADIAYTRAWARGAVATAYGGSVHKVGKAGAYARFRFTGRQVAWVASRTSTHGTARVYLDGHLTATVDLHSATPIHRRIVFAHAWKGDGVHTIKIVCAGTHGHPTVDVDAILTIR